MRKLLIVDSGPEDRERLASLLKWESYGIALAGMAENGERGLEKIREIRPDIVITDIRMPVMNGVEMIESGRKIKPEIIFIVVAQYEGYEYTSKMMECGVKYYLLKPCRQDRLKEAVMKALDELTSFEEREEGGRMRLFRNSAFSGAVNSDDRMILLARAERECDYTFLSPLRDSRERLHRLIVCRTGEHIDILGQYAAERPSGQKEGRKVRWNSPEIWKDGKKVPFHISQKEESYLYQALRRIVEEGKTGSTAFLLSVHVFQNIMEARDPGEWPPRPFPEVIVREPESLKEAFFYIRGSAPEGTKIPYFHLKGEKDCAALLFHLNLIYSMFTVKNCTAKEILQMSAVLVGTLYHAGTEKLYNRLPEKYTKALVYKTVQQIIVEEEFGDLPSEEFKMAAILQAIYANLNKKELSDLWLCRNILHMNEDYFSRIFMAGMHEKFSVYLTKIRIETAAGIMRSEPEIPVSNLAQIVGYDADGQHFSRVFKKYMGIPPSRFKSREPFFG